MAIAVQFGAGNIGRGFIGQLFALSGYEVVFVDVDQAAVAALNERRRYPVRVVSNVGGEESLVENVRAIDGRDHEAVAAAVSRAAIVGTAVGAGALPAIARPLAAGLELRWKESGAIPLNVILCENLAGADAKMRSLVEAALPPQSRPLLAGLAGFVRASVGRMVPVMTDAMREGDPLRIWVERYDRLPVDADAFVGPIPRVEHLEPVSPFGFYERRKLFVHNLGHAALAYLGALSGHRFIWEAAEDEALASLAAEAMDESARAIAAAYGAPLEALREHALDLLGRFANRGLGDTVARVGRDLPRKLAPGDRIMGAIDLCESQGVERDAILLTLAAALRFDDPASGKVGELLSSGGPAAALEGICGMRPGRPDEELALALYRLLGGPLRLHLKTAERAGT